MCACAGVHKVLSPAPFSPGAVTEHSPMAALASSVPGPAGTGCAHPAVAARLAEPQSLLMSEMRRAL